jgi:hypothetical protein
MSVQSDFCLALTFNITFSITSTLTAGANAAELLRAEG